MDNKPLVIAHGNCADGFTSLWLANAWWWGTRNPGVPNDLVVDYHAGFYGEPPPEATERDVFILDFSYPPEELLVIAEQAKSVVVIDHHESAIRKLEGFSHPKVKLVLDTNRSGAYLTSQYFWPNSEPMVMVRLVDDRDRWVFADTRSRPFHASLFSRPYKIGEWNRLNANVAGAVIEGEAIERKHMKDIDELLARTARVMSFKQVDVDLDMEIVVANMPYFFASDGGHKMLEQHPTVHVAATYYVDNKGRYCFSLRSRKDGVNVALLAEYFGGGGHASAAGFTVMEFPFV